MRLWSFWNDSDRICRGLSTCSFWEDSTGNLVHFNWIPIKTHQKRVSNHYKPAINSSSIQIVGQTPNIDIWYRMNVSGHFPCKLFQFFISQLFVYKSLSNDSSDFLYVDLTAVQLVLQKFCNRKFEFMRILLFSYQLYSFPSAHVLTFQAHCHLVLCIASLRYHCRLLELFTHFFEKCLFFSPSCS